MNVWLCTASREDKIKDKKITLTIAHLKIALLGGNSEVGNSEYINHQNCPPQLLCIFSVNMAIGWVLEAYDVYSK